MRGPGELMKSCRHGPTSTPPKGHRMIRSGSEVRQCSAARTPFLGTETQNGVGG